MAGAGTFAEEMIIPHQGVVKIDDDIPLEIGSLVGCGVMTGVGAAINTAKVTPRLVRGRVRLRRRGDLLHHGRQGRRRLGHRGRRPQRREARGRPRPSAPPTRASPTSSTASRPASPAATASTTPSRPSACRARCAPPTTPSAAAARPASSAWASSTSSSASRPSSCSSPRRTSSARYYGSADVRTDFHKLLGFYKDGSLALADMITRRIKLDEINDAFGAMAARRGHPPGHLLLARRGPSGRRLRGAQRAPHHRVPVLPDHGPVIGAFLTGLREQVLIGIQGPGRQGDRAAHGVRQHHRRGAHRAGRGGSRAAWWTRGPGSASRCRSTRCRCRSPGRSCGPTAPTSASCSRSMPARSTACPPACGSSPRWAAEREGSIHDLECWEPA